MGHGFIERTLKKWGEKEENRTPDTCFQTPVPADGLAAPAG